MNMESKKIQVRDAQGIPDATAEVEWYSGGEMYTHPTRIKKDGIWEEVFQYERSIREVDQQRQIVFHCHIGDNRIIQVVVL
jgi:hypothetical protein